MLIIHGEDDEIVPVSAAKATAALVPRAELKLYPGAPHGILETHHDELSRDMLAFLRGAAS